MASSSGYDQRPEVQAELDRIYERVRADRFWDHLRTDGIKLVPGLGSHRPNVLLIGEAPGATENTHGRPFCGASGRVLDGLLEVAGIVDRDYFVTNVVKYRPPGNRTPTHPEIVHGVQALRQEFWALGSPGVIVAVGAVAKVAMAVQQEDSGERVRISRAPAGRPYALRAGHVLWPMYHPAFGLRRPDMRGVMEEHWEGMGEWMRLNARL